MLNLILAMLWFLGAIGVFAWQLQGGGRNLYLGLFGSPVSVAWLMLVMAGFNLLRWYVRQGVRASHLAERRAAEARRLRSERRDPPEGGREPDPNFMFTDEPPPVRRRSITDEPSPN
jgi:hypothetical protein